MNISLVLKVKLTLCALHNNPITLNSYFVKYFCSKVLTFLKTYYNNVDKEKAFDKCSWPLQNSKKNILYKNGFEFN